MWDPCHRTQDQLVKSSQEGDPVLRDFSTEQASTMSEEEATKAQARKAKQQQDQRGTDQRWVVGQTQMQAVLCLTAAYGKWRDLGL